MPQALRKRTDLAHSVEVTTPVPYVPDSEMIQVSDAASCDAPRRGLLAISVLKMNAIGLVANTLAAGIAFSILARPAVELGMSVESYGFLFGRDADMTGRNVQSLAALMLTFVTMLINVGIVFHLIHDAALHYRFRSWTCRVLASVIASLSIINGEREKSWSRDMLDRSRMDRVIGCIILMLAGIPLFVLGSLAPWVTVLAWLGFPAGTTTVVLAGQAIVLVPTVIELVRIAFHVLAADPAE